jgi:hypothetical protein
VISQYLAAALRRAGYEILPDDGHELTIKAAA